MSRPAFSEKWTLLAPPERRLTGIRVAELADPASEAQAIAIALREAIETPGQTAALVTPDRDLAAARFGASRALGQLRPTTAPASRCRIPPAGTLLLAAAAAVGREACAGSVARPAEASAGRRGGRATACRGWKRFARLDLALRGPRPRPGIEGLDDRFAAKGPRIGGDCSSARCAAGSRASAPDRLRRSAARLREIGATRWPVTRRGAVRTAGWPPNCLAELEQSADAAAIAIASDDVMPLLRGLMDAHAGPPALWRPSAHFHLGIARSAAAKGRPDDPRRDERGRMAVASQPRSMAATAGPSALWDCRDWSFAPGLPRMTS